MTSDTHSIILSDTTAVLGSVKSFICELNPPIFPTCEMKLGLMGLTFAGQLPDKDRQPLALMLDLVQDRSICINASPYWRRALKIFMPDSYNVNCSPISWSRLGKPDRVDRIAVEFREAVDLNTWGFSDEECQNLNVFLEIILAPDEPGSSNNCGARVNSSKVTFAPSTSGVCHVRFNGFDCWSQWSRLIMRTCAMYHVYSVRPGCIHTAVKRFSLCSHYFAKIRRSIQSPAATEWFYSIFL